MLKLTKSDVVVEERSIKAHQYLDWSPPSFYQWKQEH